MKITAGPPAADTSDLRRFIIGPDLALTEDDDRRLVLYSLGGPRSHLLGSFADVVDAWRAVDELDSPGELDIAA